MDEQFKSKVVVSRGIRNNNPSNIKISSDRWQGQVPPCDAKDKTFCQFYGIDFGIRALLVLLSNYIVKGYNTPRKIIARFAPSSENHTENYTRFVMSYINDGVLEQSFSPDDFVERYSFTFFKLCAAICYYESEYKLTYTHYKNIINHFHLN